MNATEYEAWKRETMSHPGHWKADPIHAIKTDSLFYAVRPGDEACGVYVRITADAVEAGAFEGAVPHIGEALFVPKTTRTSNDPWKTAVETLGLSFLLAMTATTSPYRNL